MQVERDVKDHRDRLAVVIEATGAAIWEWDVQKQKIILSVTWKKLLGYEDHELESSYSSWEQFCHQEDIPVVKQAVKDYLAGQTDKFLTEHRVRHKDGDFRWVRSTGRLIFGEKENPLRWLGSVIDITEHKIAAQIQQEQSRTIGAFAQVMADIGLIINEDGYYIEVFGDADLLILPREEHYGKCLFDILPVETANTLFEEIRETIREGKVRRKKVKLNFHQKQQIFDARFAVINHIIGGKKSVAVALTEITEQEKIREYLHMSYEMRRRSDIFNDLLNGARLLDEELAAYVKNMQLNFTQTLFCCLIWVDKEGYSTNLDALQSLKDEVISKIHGIEGCIVWGCRGNIGVVCQAAHSSRYKIAKSLYDLIICEYPELRLNIGIGEIQKGLKGFQKSFQQAWDAAAASSQGPILDKKIVYFRELGIFQLLLDLQGKERAEDFTRITIQKLIQYDREKGTSYLDTLEVLMQSASLKEAAQTLFLHHNTVLFRRRRIEEILGQSITDFDTKLSLALAIKFYRMQSGK